MNRQKGMDYNDLTDDDGTPRDSGPNPAIRTRDHHQEIDYSPAPADGYPDGYPSTRPVTPHHFTNCIPCCQSRAHPQNAELRAMLDRHGVQLQRSAPLHPRLDSVEFNDKTPDRQGLHALEEIPPSELQAARGLEEHALYSDMPALIPVEPGDFRDGGAELEVTYPHHWSRLRQEEMATLRRSVPHARRRTLPPHYAHRTNTRTQRLILDLSTWDSITRFGGADVELTSYSTSK